MTFILTALKNHRLLLGVIISIFTCFSCQNLNPKRNAGISAAPFFISNNKASKSPLIDKNYMEHQALLYYLKAENALFESDSTKALNYLKKSILLEPQSSHFKKRMAEIYEMEALFAESANIYENLLKKQAEKKEWRKKLIDLYARQGLNNKALEQNALLLKQNPHSFNLILKQALLFLKQENWKSALKTLNKTDSKAIFLEERAQLLLLQAYAFIKQNQIEKSLSVIEKIKKTTVPHEELALKIADFYTNFNTESALLYLKDFQQKNGSTQQTTRFLLKQALSSKNWKTAMHYTQKLKDFGALEEPHYFYSALFHLKEKQYNQAILYLKDLVNQNPGNGYYTYLLAASYEKNQEWNKATSLYQKTPSHSPYFLTAHLQLAQLWQKQGLYKKSLGLLKSLAFNKPVSPQAVLLYAELLWDIGKKKQALSALTKALKHHHNHLGILFLRGFYFKQSGSANLALEDMNQILKIRSNHSEALKLIASLQSENS